MPALIALPRDHRPGRRSGISPAAARCAPPRTRRWTTRSPL